MKRSIQLTAAVLGLAMLFAGCGAPGGASAAVSTEDVPEAPASIPTAAEAYSGNGPSDTITADKKPPNNENTDETARIFEGDWRRTGVIRAAAATLTITGETEADFDFTLVAFWGDHFGEIAGSAEKRDGGKAVFILDAGMLWFSITGGSDIRLSYEGDISALDFGQNVLPDGLYIKREPEYKSDGYPALVFGGEELMEKTKALISNTNEQGDDTAYENLLTLMREGLPEVVDYGRYKGFMTSGRETGADLYISQSGHIYLMAYGLDKQPYVFFTTDILYHGWMQFPEYLVLPENINTEDIVFLYYGYSGGAD